MAKELGAKVRPGSGSLTGAKGDIPAGQFLLEAKSTTNESMQVRLDWLAKISQEARMEARTPALTVSFVRHDGKPQRFGDWVMVPLSWWKQHINSDGLP